MFEKVPLIAFHIPGSGVNHTTVYQLEYQWYRVWVDAATQVDEQLKEANRGTK